jgi:integrase
VLGTRLGGWYDFGHMVATKLRGHNQKIVSELLGNSVKTMFDVYQHIDTEDLVEPMNERASELLGPTKQEVVSKLLANGFIN